MVPFEVPLIWMLTPTKVSPFSSETTPLTVVWANACSPMKRTAKNTIIRLDINIFDIMLMIILENYFLVNTKPMEPAFVLNW